MAATSKHGTLREDFFRKRDFAVRHGTLREDFDPKCDFTVQRGTLREDFDQKRDFAVQRGTLREDFSRFPDLEVPPAMPLTTFASKKGQNAPGKAGLVQLVSVSGHR